MKHIYVVFGNSYYVYKAFSNFLDFCPKIESVYIFADFKREFHRPAYMYQSLRNSSNSLKECYIDVGNNRQNDELALKEFLINCTALQQIRINNLPKNNSLSNLLSNSRNSLTTLNFFCKTLSENDIVQERLLRGAISPPWGWLSSVKMTILREFVLY